VVRLRLDHDLVGHLKADGPGWHTLINAALRRVVEHEKA
jgi:uncharacterized protein (DUF4415 family)